MRRRDLSILVVDDNPSDRALICATLQSMGFVNIQTAEDGKLASYKASNAEKVNSPFQLVLVDWSMPSATGLRFLQYVRSDKQLKDTVVFIVTGTAEIGRVTDAIRNGVNDFIVKPIVPSVLEGKLKSFFVFET